MADTKPIKVGLYARISTLGKGQNTDVQLRELREYCERRGWPVSGEYVDSGVSGSKEKRPELDRLMADAHRRRFDAVAAWKFDRFARSVSHLLRALETFRALGIEFVSLSEQIDTSAPMGKMVFTILGSVAELERSMIVERVKAGLRNARAKGIRLGRPRSILHTAKIARLRKAGRSWRQIARIMDCFRLGLAEGRGKTSRDFCPSQLQIHATNLRLWQKQMLLTCSINQTRCDRMSLTQEQEVHPTGQPIDKLDLRLSEVVLAKFPGETFETNQRLYFLRTKRSH